MHYFSIHSESGAHLGFLIMLPDDENAARPTAGRFAVKLQDGAEHSAPAALSALQGADESQVWQAGKDGVSLYRDGGLCASIRNEFFTVGGHTLVLNDMTGML